MPNTQGMAAQNTTSDPNIDIGSPYTPRRPSPIVSISVNHPIAQMARKIKNFLVHKQTLLSTTFSIKITPIVAIVSLFGLAALFGGGITTAFQFGKTVEQKFLAATLTPTPTVTPKVSPTPSSVIVSKTGTIQATYQNPPMPSIETPTPSGSESATITQPTPTPRPILHYILVSRSGSILYLATSTTVHFANYLGVRVLITGSFDSSKNTLTVAKGEDIEVLQ